MACDWRHLRTWLTEFQFNYFYGVNMRQLGCGLEPEIARIGGSNNGNKRTFGVKLKAKSDLAIDTPIVC